MAKRKHSNSSDQEEQDLQTDMDYNKEDIPYHETADEKFLDAGDNSDIAVSPSTPKVDSSEGDAVDNESRELTHSTLNSGSAQDDSDYDLLHHSESDDNRDEFNREIFDELFETFYIFYFVYYAAQLEIFLRLLRRVWLIVTVHYNDEESSSIEENRGEERDSNRSVTDVSDSVTMDKQQKHDNSLDVEEYAGGNVSVIQDEEPWGMNNNHSISEDGEQIDELSYSDVDSERSEEQDYDFDLNRVGLYYRVTGLVIEYGEPWDLNIEPTINEGEEVRDEYLYSDGDSAENSSVTELHPINLEHTSVPNSFIENEDSRDLNIYNLTFEEEEEDEDDLYFDSDFAENCTVKELNRINLEHTGITHSFIEDEDLRDINIYDLMSEEEEVKKDDLYSVDDSAEKSEATKCNRINGKHEEGNYLQFYSDVDSAEKSRESENAYLNAVTVHMGIPDLVCEDKETCDINLDFSIKEDEEEKMNGSHSIVEPTEKSDQVTENELKGDKMKEK